MRDYSITITCAFSSCSKNCKRIEREIEISSKDTLEQFKEKFLDASKALCTPDKIEIIDSAGFEYTLEGLGYISKGWQNRIEIETKDDFIISTIYKLMLLLEEYDDDLIYHMISEGYSDEMDRIKEELEDNLLGSYRECELDSLGKEWSELNFDLDVIPEEILDVVDWQKLGEQLIENDSFSFVYRNGEGYNDKYHVFYYDYKNKRMKNKLY